MILPRLKQATAARRAAIESRSALINPRLSRATCCARLTAFALASGADDEIDASANETFETFETFDRWLYPTSPQSPPDDEPASQP